MTRQTSAGPLSPADVLRRHLRVNGLGLAADQPLVDAIAGAFAELHPEVTLLKEMAVLRLEPDDILVLTADDNLTDSGVARLHAQMHERFPDNKVVILERLKLAVARPAKETPA